MQLKTLLQNDKAKARRLKTKIQRMCYQKNIIAVSDGVKNALLQDFRCQPATLNRVYNAFDLQAIQTMAQQPDVNIPDEPFILHPSRLDFPVKRQDLLLQAFKALNEPYKLVLFAQPNTELTTMIRQLQLTDSVLVVGQQANPFNWMKQAALTVMCSKHEGFGRVIVESLACGTPVVSTDCPSGPSEILTGELARWLVPNNDLHALVATIKQALNCQITIDLAHLSKFDIKETINQYLNLIETSSLIAA